MDSRFNRLRAMVLMVLVTVTGSLSAEYVAPNFHKKVFDSDRILLGAKERRELCDALTAAAANFPEDEAGVPFQVKEMVLSIALRLDAVHSGAQGVHETLNKKQRPSKIDGFETKVLIAEKLRRIATRLSDEEAVADERVLVCYLLDIARHLDPANADGVARFQVATTKASYPGWGGILNSATGGGFLFPPNTEATDGNDGGGTGTFPTPPVPAGNPDASLKGDQSEALLLGFGESPGGAPVGTVVKISLKTSADIREAGQPIRVLFPVPPLADAIPMSESGDAVIEALASLHEDWPASGQKVVARFEPSYVKQNRRSGELALALALDGLFSGEVPEKMPVAVGRVAANGAISGVSGLRQRFRYLKKTDRCDRLLIPEELENELVDILIVGAVKSLLRVQVLKVSTLEDALKVARGDFTTEEQKALLDFTEIRNVAGRSSSPEEILRTEIVRTRLSEIVEAMPQHVSAALLLQFASGELPARLSVSGSVEELRTVLFPYARLLKSTEVLTGANAETLRAKTSVRLTALREKLAPDLVAVGDQISDYANNLEAYAKLNSKSSAKAADLKKGLGEAWEKINAELDSQGNVNETAIPDEE